MTIKELLKSLQTKTKVVLENTKETWSRIGRKETISELEGEGSLESALQDWISENPYNDAV